MAVHDMLMAAAGGTSADVAYIDDVFSTYLYTGNGSTQTITNGIDLAGEGGLVWIKNRGRARSHQLSDTAQGVGWYLSSNTTNPAYNDTNRLAAFNANGFSLGADTFNSDWNFSGDTYASWTFRKQPKFFDIVTYTGNGTTQNIAHNLGSTPGCVIVKCTNAGAGWYVWHRGQSSGYYSILNSTAAQTNSFSSVTFGNNSTYVDPTSTQFTVGSNGNINDSGNTYVAYLFAHDAGGFGAAGTDNVISCGSFTTPALGGTTSVNLGYEPQWIMMKSSNSTTSWWMVDNMRGLPSSTADRTAKLYANLSNAEGGSAPGGISINATGFTVDDNLVGGGTSMIYIAIRRPMKPPTTGTEVFSPTLSTFSGTTVTNTGFVVDMVINKNGVATTSNNFVLDRLRGSGNSSNQQTISTNTTSAEVASSGRVALTGTTTIQNGFLCQETTANNIVWAFRRAPGFFDEVCYTGNGTAGRTLNHNLIVAPELMIVKMRNVGGTEWTVYHSALGNTKYIPLNSNSTPSTWSGAWNNTSPTSSVFTLGNGGAVNNGGGETYVAYLFATVAGVSKVGSYTGTGTTNAINCGFSGGARFVLIKRTDSTGDWYVWDTARGIVSGNDPYLLLNSTAAEVTDTDYIDPSSSGFEISSSAPSAINASGGSFIFMAIS